MKKTPILYVIFAGLAWGSAGLFVHLLSSYFSSLELALTRASVSAGLAILVALITNPKSLKITFRQLLPLALFHR